MITRLYPLAVIMLFGFFALSCSNGSSSPLLPSAESSPPGIPVKSSAGFWGYWEISINPDTALVDIVPLRSSEFAANITVFLQPPKGSTSNLGIDIVDLSDWLTEGRMDLDVRIHHPFPGLDMYTGFDVMGIFISYGDTEGKYDPTINYATGDETAHLLNPDGYTRWYNPVEFLAPNILGFVEGIYGTKDAEFTSTLNPYKYFADGLDGEGLLTDFFSEEPNLAKRGFFSPTVNTRRYELKFPVVSGSPEIRFQYAVVGFWEPPEGPSPIDVPDDFPITANRGEPINISVVDNGSDLFHTDDFSGGTLRVSTEIWDWAAPYNPSGVPSEIGSIILESGSVEFPGEYTELTTDQFEIAWEPGTSVSSVANIELTGLNPLESGIATFLMTVESINPDSYEQGFTVPVPDAPLASYFFFDIPIADDNPCEPPSILLDAPHDGTAGIVIDFDASATTGTPPLQFEWDWDGDDVYDETNDTGYASHVFPPGTWYVGLRVTNGCGEDILDPPHEITITCPDEVHSTYLGVVNPEGDFDDLRQDGTCFLPDGRLLVKRQDQLVALEVTAPGPVTPEVIISDLAHSEYSAGMWTYIVNLDYDEYMDRIVYTVAPSPDEVVIIYDSEGNYITEFTVPGSDGVLTGLDTDADGSIWCIYHTPGGTTGTNELTHWEWDETGGIYTQVTEDTLDCTFVEGGARGIYDIAVIPEAERLYILHNDGYPWRGAIYVLDISVSPPERLVSLDQSQIFSWTGNTGASISDYHKWEGGSIEVDHGDSTVETCRLIVCHNFQNGGDGIGLMKFDADLNTLDTYRRTGTRMLSLSIRPGPETSDRLIAMPAWSHGACNLHVFEAPAGW